MDSVEVPAVQTGSNQLHVYVGIFYSTVSPRGHRPQKVWGYDSGFGC